MAHRHRVLPPARSQQPTETARLERRAQADNGLCRGDRQATGPAGKGIVGKSLVVALLLALGGGLAPGLASGLGSAGGSAAAPAETDKEPFASHRAFYALSLDRSSNSSDLAAVEGGFGFEWVMGCQGYTVQQHAEIRYIRNDGEVQDFGWNFVAWEAKNGSRYRFTMRKTRFGEIHDEIKGDARALADGRIKVVFSLPEAKEVLLPEGTLFPSAHTLALIKAAHNQERHFLRQVFDGTEFQEAAEINALIGDLNPDPEAIPTPLQASAPKEEESDSAEAVTIDAELLAQPAWPVTLAFFPPSSRGGSLPDHEQHLQVQPNAVVRSLLLDYGRFRIRAALTRLKAVPKPAC